VAGFGSFSCIFENFVVKKIGEFIALRRGDGPRGPGGRKRHLLWLLVGWILVVKLPRNGYASFQD